MLESKKRVILIIDDIITNLKVAVDYLKAYGFEIIIARNGETGIERAKFAQPDLILLDVQMPGIDGFETCKRLKSNMETAGIPVIFMTGLADSVDKVKGLEAGAVDYVTKPIDAAEVLARINIHLTLTDLQHRLLNQNEELEHKVQERTAALEAEMTHRAQQQEEKEHLFNIVREQSEQLRTLTNLFIETQQEHTKEIIHSLREQMGHELGLLDFKLKLVQRMLNERAKPSQTNEQLLEHITSALDILSRAQQQAQEVSTNLDQATSENQALLENPLFNLSTREYEVLQLLASGKTTTEIAAVLVVSKTTVSTYRKRIMQKLDIHDLPSLVKFALQNKMTN